MKKDLYDILGQEIDVPNSFTNSISRFEYKKKRDIKTKLYTKVAIAFSFLIVSVNLVTYGLKISDNFKAESAIGYVDSSVQQAIENGYIQNVEMDYLYSKGIGAKIDYIVMSDYNLNILFDFDISKKNIKYNMRTYIEDMLIYDENNNIIYCYDYKIYEKFCKKKGIEYNKNVVEQYANGLGRQQIELSSSINKTLYTISTTKELPKSKKIYIEFDKIYFNTEKNNSVKGKWNFELNLNEQFYNREEIRYELVTESNDIELISANITDTRMRIKYKMKEIDTIDIDNISMYIEENLGNRYNMNNIEDIVSIYNNEISVAFPIVIKDNFEYLILYISINGEEYIPIRLERK